MNKLLAALTLLGFATCAQAFCFAEAASRYGVDEQLLIGIAKTESNFNPNATHINKDKTKDVGLMQINSSLLPALSKYHITEEALFDPCISAHVGAWVLAQSIRFFGRTWRAVGGYGAGLLPERETARQVYAQKVARALEQLSKTPFVPSSAASAPVQPTMRVVE